MFVRAKRLMDTTKNRAFDISEEPDSITKLYGESQVGEGCIAARRLLEAGVKVVEVVQGGWDTHANEHAAVKALAEGLDPAFAGLIKDLKDRGMLDSTIVYCFSEFGRTPNVGGGGNGDGGRGHYPQAFSVAFAGGGVRGGRVIGATDPDGVMCTQRPVLVQELHATICHTLGLEQDKHALRRPSADPHRRPLRGRGPPARARALRVGAPPLSAGGSSPVGALRAADSRGRGRGAWRAPVCERGHAFSFVGARQAPLPNHFFSGSVASAPGGAYPGQSSRAGGRGPTLSSSILISLS